RQQLIELRVQRSMFRWKTTAFLTRGAIVIIRVVFGRKERREGVPRLGRQLMKLISLQILRRWLSELFDFGLLLGHNPRQLIRVDVVHEGHADVHASLLHLVDGPSARDGNQGCSNKKYHGEQSHVE
ncbi:hypothetical protein PMAYCL1PPCAC_08209, partial [Pristionchus mayeri]